MSEKLILALDGATRTSSAAVLRRRSEAGLGGWEVLAHREESDARGQARILLRSVDEMLTSLAAHPADLAGIAVGIGPGTFTGVRIAVATARGLALSLGIPVVGVSTLALLAAAAVDGSERPDTQAGTCLVPIVDARRQQVFYATFDGQGGAEGTGSDGWVRTGPIGVCGQEEFGEKLRGIAAERVLVVGESRGLVGELPVGTAFVERTVAAEYLVVGQELFREPVGPGGGREARSWLSGAMEEAQEGDVSGDRVGDGLSPERVKPLYVRAPDADVHITKMKDPWDNGS